MNGFSFPKLANAGSRPRQLFGLMENEGNDQGLPHGLEATKRMKDLLHPFDQSLLLEPAIGRDDKHFLTCMRLTYKRMGLLIADCQLPISDWRLPIKPIGDRDVRRAQESAGLWDS
jgi:hypothetical protein